MKKQDYFSHDYHSRDHLRDIRKDWKLAGVGFYWCLVEILHENGGSIKESEVEEIADDLRAEPEMAHDVVYKYGKFQLKKGRIYSSRVNENLQKREEISEKRKQASKTRWDSRGDKGDDKASVPAPLPTDFEKRLNEFCEAYGVQLDDYSPYLAELDFSKLSEAYSKSKKFLQVAPCAKHISWICKNYASIIGGKYIDKETTVRKGGTGKAYPNAQHDSLIDECTAAAERARLRDEEERQKRGGGDG